jgi:polyhydroxyalkanoate synthesis regulator phasin
MNHKNGGDMFEKFKEQIDKGVDYATATTDKVIKAAKDLAKENNLTKEEAKRLLDQMIKKSEEVQKSMEDSLQNAVKSMLKKLDVPTREDIMRLEERLNKLEKFHSKPVKKKIPAKKSAGAKKRTTPPKKG